MRDAFIKKMEPAFPEEMQSARKYLQMAKEADAAGEEDISEGFMEMAHDEYTHAQFMYNEMCEEGHEICEAHKKMWEELDMMMGQMF